MCNVILFWAVSVSVKHLEHCWATILCLCTGTDLQDHGCSAAGAGWFCSPVSNNGYSQLLLRENPNSPRFFLRNTTLCRCRIVYPSNYFYLFFYLIPVFIPWSMRFSGFFPYPSRATERCSAWISKFYNCSVPLCTLHDIRWIFSPKIQQCRSGSRIQLQYVSLVQTRNRNK